MDGKEEHRQRSTKSTETAAEVSNLTRKFYDLAWEAKKRDDMSVAWCMMDTPQEVLMAMDIVPIYPEQYSAACAAKQLAASYCERAEAEGFSVDVCSFCRTGLGYAALFNETDEAPPGAPYGGIPEPDMLMCRGGCDPGYKWFQALRYHYWDVPLFVNDGYTPPPDADMWDEEVASRYIAYNLGQFKDLVAFLEKATGRKMDWDRLGQMLRDSQEVRKLSYEIQQLRRAVPSPMATQDHMASILPFRILAGTKEALDYARRLYDEVKYRVDNKIGAIPDEKYRLLWEGIAAYHSMGLYNYLESLGAVCVIETYFTPMTPVEIDLSNPLESLAKREYWAGVRIRVGEGKSELGDARIGVPMELYLELVKDYQVDGAISHSIRSCRILSIGQLRAKQMLEKHMNIPVMFIEGDMADARAYSEAESKERINAFMEMVAASKEAKG